MIRESISVDHLSTAYLLVIVHIWFSVFLLGCGSPYMGISFSGTGSMPPPRTWLGRLEAGGLLLFYFFDVLHVYSSQGLNV